MAQGLLRIARSARHGATTQLDIHLDGIQVPLFPQLDKIVRGKFRYRQDLLLDLGREDIHPADDKHVIAAAGDPVHTAHGADTAGEEAGEVPGAVAYHRHGLLG